MNRLKSHILLSLITLMACAVSTPSFAGSIKGASLAVYNSGRALVKEFRTVTLPKGMASVVFKDVPSSLDPTSVRASAKGMTVLDLEYSHIPISEANLLDRYLGKELTVIMPDPADADARVLRKAVLIAVGPQPVFHVGKEVYVGKYDALLFPELPEGLQQEPTLTLTTDNEAAAKRDVMLNYLMGGLNWRADYTLSIDRSGDSASLDSWATVNNTSGHGFLGASLKLIAGDVARAPQPRRSRAKNMVMMESVAAPAPGIAEESFAEYHAYSIDRKVNLTADGTRQLSLFSAPEVGVKQQLVSRFHVGVGQRSAPIRQQVRSVVTLANTEANGMGNPMPGGLVRVFMPGSDGSMLLAGESRIGHVGKGGEIKLRLGSAFDVSVERRQTSFKKLGKNSFEMEWQIRIVNGKAAPQPIKLRDAYRGQWKINAADRKYTRPDAGTLEFDLTVPPSRNGKPTIVNYSVQVTY